MASGRPAPIHQCGRQEYERARPALNNPGVTETRLWGVLREDHGDTARDRRGRQALMRATGLGDHRAVPARLGRDGQRRVQVGAVEANQPEGGFETRKDCETLRYGELISGPLLRGTKMDSKEIEKTSSEPFARHVPVTFQEDGQRARRRRGPGFLKDRVSGIGAPTTYPTPVWATSSRRATGP